MPPPFRRVCRPLLQNEEQDLRWDCLQPVGCHVIESLADLLPCAISQRGVRWRRLWRWWRRGIPLQGSSRLLSGAPPLANPLNNLGKVLLHCLMISLEAILEHLYVQRSGFSVRPQLNHVLDEGLVGQTLVLLILAITVQAGPASTQTAIREDDCLHFTHCFADLIFIYFEVIREEPLDIILVLDLLPLCKGDAARLVDINLLESV
mmetsp:Transcript_11261/g.20591  ORF Transcript_11261/g.20591 Transcript_11261/m.20591 type:complete len:206 (-) Transcript_11261:1253-1870(-)